MTALLKKPNRALIIDVDNQIHISYLTNTVIIGEQQQFLEYTAMNFMHSNLDLVFTYPD